ncbi:MAG TPA: hypothetical protein VF613_07620 [Longimicrobium sp.]|jgi:hypothetical protein
MRITRPPGLSVLLLGATLAALPAAAQTDPVTVHASHLQALQGRLDGFSSGLRAGERALWNRLLLRAAHAPASGSEVRVLPVLHIGPGGGCDAGMDDGPNRVAIIIQGGRTGGGLAPAPASGIIVQGGRTASPGARTRVGARSGAPAAGVTRPTDVVSIGPKQEDPAWPAPESLARRVTELSAQLPAEERGALEWLLTRAAAVPEGRSGTPGGLPPGAAVAAAPEGRPASPGGRPAGAAGVARPLGQPGPGGLPEGTAVSLRQALGVDVLSLGPKQEDPGRAPPTPATRWTLRH